LLGESVNPTETLLNTLGGAVWQWVLTVCMENLEGEDNKEYKTSASIAFSVAASTFVMTLLAWLLNNNRPAPREDDTTSAFIMKPALTYLPD
jgi:hypothetical protein